jgi:hypothetical protein
MHASIVSIKVNKKLALYSRRVVGISVGVYAIVYTDVSMINGALSD